VTDVFWESRGASFTPSRPLCFFPLAGSWRLSCNILRTPTAGPVSLNILNYSKHQSRHDRGASISRAAYKLNLRISNHSYLKLLQARHEKRLHQASNHQFHATHEIIRNSIDQKSKHRPLYPGSQLPSQTTSTVLSGLRPQSHQWLRLHRSSTAVCRTKARTPFLSERSICTRGPIHDYLIVGLHHKLLLKLKTLLSDLSSIYYN
jgi:hypothetical protein